MEPTALALYLSSVLTVLAPHVREARRASIAGDIAAVAIAEEPAFAGDDSRQQTALLMASLAYYETGKSWAEWVDDGRCNDPAWRETHKLWMKGKDGHTYDCDGARAFSMWQIHPYGIDSKDEGTVQRARVVGQTYARDRRAAVRAALAVARASIRAGVGLCHYSGESYPHCRLAKARLDAARGWVTRFPYPPPAPLPPGPAPAAAALAISPDPADHTATGIE